MPTPPRLWTGCTLAALVLFASACRQEPEPKPKPETRELEELSACARDIQAILSSPADTRSTALAGFLPASQRCATLLTRGCHYTLDDQRTMSAEVEPSSSALIEGQLRRCLDNACPQLSPRPELCEDFEGVTSQGREVILSAMSEFWQASLAHEYQLPRDHLKIQEVARGFAPLWADALVPWPIELSPPSLSAALPVPLTVLLEDDGSIVVESEGAERQTLAPLPEKTHDLAALTRLAQTHKKTKPELLQIQIAASSNVPMQAVIKTMDALRGQACDYPEGPVEDCLFPQPIFLTIEP